MFRPFNMTTNYDASQNDSIEIYKNHLSYIFAIWTMKIFSVVMLRLGFHILSGIWNTVFPPIEIWLEEFFYKTEKVLEWSLVWAMNLKRDLSNGSVQTRRRRSRTAKVWTDLSCPCPTGQGTEFLQKSDRIRRSDRIETNRIRTDRHRIENPERIRTADRNRTGFSGKSWQKRDTNRTRTVLFVDV